MTIAELKVLCAKYLNKTVADFSITDGGTTVDFLLAAINSAKRSAQLIHDFERCRVRATINGFGQNEESDISGLMVLGTSTPIDLKRIERVQMFVADGYVPIDFLSQDEFTSRVYRAIGREWEGASVTLASLGYTPDRPIVIHHGEKLRRFFTPDIDPTEPPEIVFDVIQFLPDYSGTITSDFFLTEGWQYLMWQAIYELNDVWKEFVPRQEGNIDPAEIQGKASMALQSLVAWDIGIPDGTKLAQVAPPSTASAQPRRGK